MPSDANIQEYSRYRDAAHQGSIRVSRRRRRKICVFNIDLAAIVCH